MKKYKLVAVLLLFACMTLHAQEENSTQKKDRLAKMQTELALSHEQVATLQQDMEQHKTALKEIKESYRPTLDAMKAEMKAVKEKYKDQDDRNGARVEMRTIKEKYKANLQPMREQMKSVKEKMKTSFQTILSEEQLTKLNAHKKMKHEKMKHEKMQDQAKRKRMCKQRKSQKQPLKPVAQ